MTDSLNDGEIVQVDSKNSGGLLAPSMIPENQEKVMAAAQETADLSSPSEEPNDDFYDDHFNAHASSPKISLNKAEKISKALAENGKRIRAEGVVSKFVHHPKSIKPQGSKVSFLSEFFLVYGFLDMIV